MRSSEVARLAGVTVRTLRHYHALGLLPEPPRRENGYRDYGAADLVTLLRVKRLASLGFSLEQIKGMLDGARDAAPADDPLDALDRELAGRIAELERQRAVVARLKAEKARADLPPEYARFMAALAGGGAGADAVELEADTILLADSLLPPSARDFVRAYYQAILSDGGIGAYAELNGRFLALDEGSSAEERAAVARGFVDFLRPRLGRIPNLAELAGTDFSQAVLDAFESFDEATLNPVQRAVGDAVAEELGWELAERGVVPKEMAAPDAAL